MQLVQSTSAYLRYTDNLPGIPPAATPVPLNEIEFTVELGVKDNQPSTALEFFL